MDSGQAKAFAEQLRGKTIGRWTAGNFLGAGKSAVVLEATSGIEVGALKVFSPDLIERFGKDNQLRRIERECELKGHDHPSLVRIFDGGECEATNFLFVVMEQLQASNLQKTLHKIPRSGIREVIKRVAEAAKFLEENNLCHRDIKPENIAASEDLSTVKLLDLGVVRPFGESDLTDDDAKPFIGTLRYSSPEFLVRKETFDREGLRAITFYQLGAVLHDMIMKKPIFEAFSDPYAVLVEAVKSESPRVAAPDVDPDLVVLANNCLVKDPGARLKLVAWEDFLSAPAPKQAIEAARTRVAKRHLQRQTEAETVSLETNDFSREAVERIESTIRLECTGNTAFPRMRVFRASDPRQLVRVVFEQSQQHDLHHRLSVQYWAEVVDGKTKRVNLKVSACFINSASDRHNESSETSIHRGALDESEELVKGALYAILDRAQGLENTDPNMIIDLKSII